MLELAHLFDNATVDHGRILSSARDLFAEILRRDIQARRHPLGFAHFMVPHGNLELRVHVWTPGQQIQDASVAIHDHMFSFVSRVLLGSLENFEYSLSENIHGSCRLFVVEYRNSLSRIVPTQTRVDLKEASRAVVEQFGLYSVDSETFHRSVVPADALVCTVVLPTATRTLPARVAGPVDGYAQDYLRTCIGLETSRDMISAVLAAIESEA